MHARLPAFFFFNGDHEVKAHLVTILVLDHEGDDRGLNDVLSTLTCCDTHLSVVSTETRDVGEWSDDHPLNGRDTSKNEIRRLFGDRIDL